MGTANIVAAAQAAGVQRLVFTSTMSVFDFMSPTLPLPLDEGDEVAPVDVYGEEKYAAELICQQAAERGDLAIPYSAPPASTVRGKRLGQCTISSVTHCEAREFRSP